MNGSVNVHVQTRPSKTRYLSLLQSLFVESQIPLRRDVVLDHLGDPISTSQTPSAIDTKTIGSIDDRKHESTVKTPPITTVTTVLEDSANIHSTFQCPELVYLFCQDISRLPNCHLYPSPTCTLPRRSEQLHQQTSQDLLSRYASTGSILPPCSSVEHEAWLLTEAGTWRWNKYPIYTAQNGRMPFVRNIQHTPIIPWKWNSQPSNLFYSPSPSFVSRGMEGRNVIPFIEIDMPECENGNTCVAKTLQIRGLPRFSGTGTGTSSSKGLGMEKGISLCKYMYQDEWKRLPYILPSNEPRPCLLCYWFYTTRLVINAMSHPGLQVVRSNFFQLHYNLVDQVGGYKKQHMLYPLRDQYLGFAHPLVHFQQELLFAYKDEELNKWRISSKSMHHVSRTSDATGLDLSRDLNTGRDRDKDRDRPETPNSHELSLGLSNMQLDSDMD